MATYYLDKTHGSASDSNAGTSASLPWLTQSKATTTVAAGDKVIVTGTYTELLSLTTTAGTELAPIVFEASSAGAWTIDAGNTRANCIVINKNWNWVKGATCTGATTRCLDWTSAVAGCIFDGCSFAKGSGGGTAGASSSAFAATTDAKFLSCTFNGFTTPMGNIAAITCAGCEFASCGTISLGTFSGTSAFNRCRFRLGAGPAIAFGGSYTNYRITNCSFYGKTSNECIQANGTTVSGLISDCIFEGGTYAITAASANPSIRVDRCAYYNQSTGQRNNVTDQSPITLTGSPYTNAAGGDLSLNNTSGAGAACRGVALGGGALGALEPTASGGGLAFPTCGPGGMF